MLRSILAMLSIALYSSDGDPSIDEVNSRIVEPSDNEILHR